MNTEDDEFNRIEREARVRMMAVRYAMEQQGLRGDQINQVMRQLPAVMFKPSPIPFVTDEEWAALNKEDDAVPTQPNT
jgi:hypothetical protein